MARLTLRPCLDCGRPSRGPRCPDHAIDYGYDSGHWQLVRAARLALDLNRCQLQLDGCTNTATTVHLDPDCSGNHLLATIDNTTSACLHCHGVVDAPRASGSLTGGVARPGNTPSQPATSKSESFVRVVS